jgi:hypothetical protein
MKAIISVQTPAGTFTATIDVPEGSSAGQLLEAAAAACQGCGLKPATPPKPPPVPPTNNRTEASERHQTPLRFRPTDDTHTAQERCASWAMAIEDVADAGELWEGFTDMTRAAIAAAPGVKFECDALTALGVMDAERLVLRAGPLRSKQVRTWWTKARAGSPGWRDPIAVLVSTLSKHPYDSPRRRREQA